MYFAISFNPLFSLLRAAVHRPLQSEHNRSFSELDLITVMRERFRARESSFG
jgi:hypothetical protein